MYATTRGLKNALVMGVNNYVYHNYIVVSITFWKHFTNEKCFDNVHLLYETGAAVDNILNS